jgi:regulator of replication initiation timing
MFISKAEKHNLYQLIAGLELRVKSIETGLMDKLKRPIPKVLDENEEQRLERQRLYNRQYYLRKKVQKLMEENKGIN